MAKPYHPFNAIIYLISNLKWAVESGQGLTSDECRELLREWDEIRRKDDEKNSSN